MKYGQAKIGEKGGRTEMMLMLQASVRCLFNSIADDLSINTDKCRMFIQNIQISEGNDRACDWMTKRE